MTGRPVNRPRSRIAAAALLAALLGVPVLTTDRAVADEVRLRNGNVIQCRVVAESPRHLVVEVPYGRMTIEREDVVEIIRGTETDYLRDASERILSAGDVEPALELLRRSLALEPDDAERRSGLVEALGRAVDHWIAERRLDKADAGLAELATLDAPESARAPRGARIAEMRRARADRERRGIEAWNAGSIETAHRLFSELTAEYPHIAERWSRALGATSVRLGHDALLGRRLDAARGHYLRALEFDPDRLPDVREPLALCEIERARPHLERGRTEEAERSLRAALEIIPDEPALLFHLALVAESRNDYREAGSLYARIAGQKNRSIEGRRYFDELRRRAAERVQGGVALDFIETVPVAAGDPADRELTREIRGGPFRVHHAAGADAERVLEALERQLRRFEKEWFGGRPAFPADTEVHVHLHPGRTALLASGAPRLADVDGYVHTVRRYGILVRQEIHLNGEAPRLTTGVVPHELAHLLLPHRIGQGIVLPSWLEEGIACSEEPRLLQRHRARQVADALRAGTVFPVPELLGASQVPAERTDLFYAQSASLTGFLRERLGIVDLLSFARTLATQGIEAALSDVAGYATVADLEYAWHRWLDR